MKEGVSKRSIDELTAAIRKRYQWASKKDKTRILDEFVAMNDYHRKHAIRLLGSNGKAESSSRPGRKKIYDEAVKDALVIF